MKKKVLFLAVGLLALVIFTTHAQQGGYSGPGTQGTQGGFGGPGASPVSVAQALTLRDDSPVILRGRIVRFLGDEKYTFTDSTGSITIEIDRRTWGTLSVNENDTVEISGEIDRELNRVEVEVATIRKI